MNYATCILGISEQLGDTVSSFFERLPSWLEEEILIPMKNWILLNGLGADMVNAAWTAMQKGREWDRHTYILVLRI
jgi:hypothetical protein